MKTPTISVLMTVYNCDQYLTEAVQSILDQTYRDFELIIIEDGSTDHSPQILNDLVKRDPRIRLYKNPKNLGLIASLNLGIKYAKGEFLARMDSDDISLPHRFEKQFNFLNANKQVGCVGAWAGKIYGDGNRNNAGFWKLPSEHSEIEAFHKAGLGAGLIHPSTMIRNELLQEIGGYAEWPLYAEDYELWCRLGSITQLHNLPEPLILYRLRASSITFTKILDQRKISLRIAEKYFGTNFQDSSLAQVSQESAVADLALDHLREAIRSKHWLTAFKIFNDSPKNAKRTIIKFHSHRAIRPFRKYYRKVMRRLNKLSLN